MYHADVRQTVSARPLSRVTSATLSEQNSERASMGALINAKPVKENQGECLCSMDPDVMLKIQTKINN